MALRHAPRRLPRRIGACIALGAAALMLASPTARAADPIKVGPRQIVVWPSEFKTGNLIYPYGQAAR